jgi:hypothetical protein
METVAIVNRLLCNAIVIGTVWAMMGAVDAQHVQITEQAVGDVMLVIDFVPCVGVEKNLRQVHRFRRVDSHNGGSVFIEFAVNFGSHDNAINARLLERVRHRQAFGSRPVFEIPMRTA